MNAPPTGTVIAIATVLTVTFAWGVALPHGLFSGDEGIKLAQIQALDETGYTDGALAYAARERDPDNTLHPLKQGGFTYERDGKVYGTYPLVYAAFAVPIYRIAGFAWVWLVSLIGLAMILSATARIAQIVSGSPRLAVLAVVSVGLATSIGMYGCAIYEHTLPAGFSTCAVAILVAPITARRAFAVGVLFALATCVRTELYAFAPSLGLLLVWRFGILAVRHPESYAPEIQAKWRSTADSDKMIEAAVAQARANQAASARASSVR